MATGIGSILRAAVRRPDDRLNILTWSTHEACDSKIARTDHAFYAFRADGLKEWNRAYRPVPPNWTLLDKAKGFDQLPVDVEFDLILGQNKYAHYELAHNLSRTLQLPMVWLEHCLPSPNMGPQQLTQLKAMRGHVNVFISEMSRAAWGWGEDEATVIHHGVDTEEFCPARGVAQNGHLLSVCNDWRNRDVWCGFNLWQHVSRDLPVHVLGDNPGISKPATSVGELVRAYQEAQVFLNTSLISPVPTALLEAMSCGTPCVSTATCMIPEIIENGVNGYLSNDPDELRFYCELLLRRPDIALRVGDAGRQTILKRFGLGRFVEDWRRLFDRAAAITYTGE